MEYSLEALTALPVEKKLDFLRKYDKNFCIFGSGKHKYQLNAPLKEEQLLFFEEKHKVKLPAEYREFIKNIGDGGAGPAYGLFPLFENEKSSQHPFLKESFLLKEDFDMENYEECFPCKCSDCTECGNRDICLTCEVGEDTFRYQSGSLAVCFKGCTFYSRLVVNGDFSGEIWEESEGDGIKRSFMGFSDWYQEWLDGSLKIIVPFVNAVLARAPYEEILELQGNHMFSFHFTKAEFVAGMIGADIQRSGQKETGKAKEEYVEKVGKAYRRYRS